MKDAYDMITKLREADEKKEKEIDLRCVQARDTIEKLRLAVANRDKTIDELRTVQVCWQFTRQTDLLRSK